MMSVWLAGSASASAAEPQMDVLAISGADEPASTVVLVQQGSSACAGFFVDDEGHIATAYHCIADGGRARIQTRDGRVARARIVSRVPRYDLAILHAEALADEPYLSPRTEPLELGMTVDAWGHPVGTPAPEGFLAGTLRWSVSRGVLASVGPRALQITAPVNPGNSGGPVVDEDGRLIGIVSRRLGGDGLGFASRAEPIVSLLEEPHPGPIIGGSIRGALIGSLLDVGGGSPSAGVTMEAAIRDRIVLGGSVAWAPQPNFDALRFGAARWSAGEFWGAARLRVGSGYWTMRGDVFGGVAIVQSVEALGEPTSFRTAVTRRAAPLVGARLALALIAVDIGLIAPGPSDDGWATRTSLVVLWPGRLGVF